MKLKEPVFFIGHGSPMNAIAHNPFTESLKKMRELSPHPRAILCVSAHWMTEGSWITHMENPKTIHDFHGFPQELFDIEYPAPGSPVIAEKISKLILNPGVYLDNEMWGLDHGSWAVLRHIYPEADIPVLQLSLNLEQPAEYHFKLGQELQKLRLLGILIVESGNIVHNLRQINWKEDAPPFPWAFEFDQWVKEKIYKKDYRPLYESYLASEAGRLSVPTPEHYYPLLYALGASDGGDELQFHFDEIHNSSISMRTFSLG